MLEITPLVLGALSWRLALTGALSDKGNSKENWKNYSVMSLVLGAVALYFPILTMDYHTRNGSFDTITDTVWGYHYGSVVLLIGMLLLNGLSWKLNKNGT